MNQHTLFAPHELGRRGEQLAAEFLKKHDYRIVALNFIARLGRSLAGRPLTGELDIIAYDGPTLCFIEVKTRRSEQFGQPEDAVDHAKQRQLLRTAARYRQVFGVSDEEYRFDVVAIILSDVEYPVVRLTKAFFSPAQWQKQCFAWQRSKAAVEWQLE